VRHLELFGLRCTYQRGDLATGQDALKTTDFGDDDELIEALIKAHTDLKGRGDHRRPGLSEARC
jgi:hypothetical protein